MDEELHIPWDSTALEGLLRKVIPTGESTKIDLKSTFDLSDSQHQAEFLKDISALANTYSPYYKNHGFIIFGTTKEGICGCTFPATSDHLQATIDDLIKKYIGPFINTYFFIFQDAEKQWGVLVIPPTRNAPHTFINDTHKRYRGDVYVRAGTTTEKALPGDYARFFRQHIEEYIYEFRQNVSDLQKEVSSLKAQIKKTSRTKPQVASVSSNEVVVVKEEVGIKIPQTLSDAIDNELSKQEDPILGGLIKEVQKINAFLASDSIPWMIRNPSSQEGQDMISKIETVSEEFWSAISNILLRDDKGQFDETILKTISFLAKQIEAPNNVSYTESANGIRYYPLVVALYLVSIIGVSKSKYGLLKKIFKLEMPSRSNYREPLPIIYSLFFIRRATEVFQSLHPGAPNQKWCDAVGSYTKSLVDRRLNPDDPLWDKESAFYKGEFILCIAPLDQLDKEAKSPMIGHPSSGLFMFMFSASPILFRFLKNEREAMRKAFDRPLEELLKEFDLNASKLSRGSGCWGDGFEGGAFEAAFPEKK